MKGIIVTDANSENDCIRKQKGLFIKLMFSSFCKYFICFQWERAI